MMFVLVASKHHLVFLVHFYLSYFGKSLYWVTFEIIIAVLKHYLENETGMNEEIVRVVLVQLCFLID